MLRILGAGPDSELAKTLDRYPDQKDRLKKQLGAFIKWKNEHPVNGSIPGKMPGFGDSDKKFRSGGNFDNRMPNIAHAHLTHNLSIVYYVDRETNTLRLYGVYSHDDIGTGSPPNINRQQQMATRWTNMRFDASEPPSALQTDKFKPDQTTTKPSVSTGKPDYTPKPKPVATPKPVVNKPSEPDRTLQFANDLEKFYPQRNLFNRLRQANSKQERLGVLTSEMAYMDLIRKRNALYPSQQKYYQGLDILFRYISQLK